MAQLVVFGFLLLPGVKSNLKMCVISFIYGSCFEIKILVFNVGLRIFWICYRVAVINFPVLHGRGCIIFALDILLSVSYLLCIRTN